jgi:hypothetical protein
LISGKPSSVGAGALPNLIVIGAQKCGTTSLHNYLDAHPEVSMSHRKETNFFLESRNWDRGVDWYARHFDPAAPVRGESSPDYTNLPLSAGTAARMHSVVPGVKLIYLVRNPVDRMTSQYLHRRAGGLERRAPAEALLDPRELYLARSCYATQLKPFLDLFPRDQILVETHECLLRQRQAALRRIFEFLGVDSSFASPKFERIWERTEGKGRLYSAAWRIRRHTQKRGLFLPDFLRWPAQRVLRFRLRNSSVHRPLIQEELREQINARLRGEVQELRALTGIELEGWDR